MWSQLYANDPNFATTYKMLGEGTLVANFHLQDGLLCHLGHLYIPSNKFVKMVWEAHYNWLVGHFGLDKIVEVLKKYFY